MHDIIELIICIVILLIQKLFGQLKCMNSNDVITDLCEDPEMKQKILDLKDELENKRVHHSSSTRRAKHHTSRS